MIKNILLLALVFYVNSVSSQASEFKWSADDSVQLDSTWKVFKTAVLQRNNAKILSLSMDSINCVLCDTSYLFDNSKWTIPKSEFVNVMYSRVFDHQIIAKIESKSYSIIYRQFDNWQPVNWNKNLNGKYTLFEINYMIHSKNELGQGHMGQNYLFQFCKINNEYKFEGVTTVP